MYILPRDAMPHCRNIRWSLAIIIQIQMRRAVFAVTVSWCSSVRPSIRPSIRNVRVLLYPDGRRYRRTSISVRQRNDSSFLSINAPIPNDNGIASAVALNRRDGKIDFQLKSPFPRKWYEIGPWLVRYVSRKS